MGLGGAVLLGSCSVPMGINTKDLVESGLSNVEVRTSSFLQDGKVVTTLRSGVDTTARIELINPKKLAVDYTLRWENEGNFASLPRLTTSQPTLVEVHFILNAGAERGTVTLNLGKFAPTTGKTFPSDTFQILCDSPPDPVANLSAGNDASRKAHFAFTLSEAPGQDDLASLELRWRDVTDTNNPGAWQTQSVSANSASLLNPGSPDLLRGVVSSKKRYFQPANIVAGRAYQLSVSVTDLGGQTSAAQMTSTSQQTNSLSYDANGGSGQVPESKTVAFGTSVTVDPSGRGTALTPPTGKVFGGWSTTADGSGTTYAAGSTVTVESDLTLFARWLSLTYHTLSYNPNGGTGTVPVDQTAVAGTTVRIDAEGLGAELTPPSGTAFGGWNTNAQGTGDTYLSGTSMTLVANTTLFARWLPLTRYTLSYHLNSGSGVLPESVSVFAGNSVIVDPSNLGTQLTPPSGFEFEGWNTDAQGNGPTYVAGSSLSLTSSLTLYARWKALTYYTLSYHANGGSGTVPSSQTAVDGTSVVVDSSGLGAQLTPPAGYEFGGWSTDAQGAGTSYPSGASFSLTATQTLYARWLPVNYASLSYSLNGGTGLIPQAQTEVKGSTVVVDPSNSGADLTPPVGYEFGGWNTDDQGGGAQYSSGSNLVLNSNVLLYARWVPLPVYTLSYDGNGGTGTLPSNQTAIEGGSVEVDPSNLGAQLTPPAGFAFRIWNTNAQGTGTNVPQGATLLLTENLILYAQWRQLNTVTVTFEPSYVQTFKFESSTKTINRGDTLEVAPSFATGTASDWRWYVDGVESTNKSSTFQGQLSVGFHNLVVVAKIGGVLYSGTLSVTVVNK